MSNRKTTTECIHYNNNNSNRKIIKAGKQKEEGSNVTSKDLSFVNAYSRSELQRHSDKITSTGGRAGEWRVDLAPQMH